MFKDKNEVEKLTIVMCGDKQVGKMTLANIFTEKKKEKGEKIEKFMPLKSFKNNAIVCHNETISVDIIALSGDKRYRNVNNHYYHKANAVIFVYDVSNEQSFHELENFYRDFQKHVANRPVILVGNKIDLERRVKTDDALSWARKNNMHFMEVSNETPSRVKTLFNRVAYEAYSAYLESEGRLPLEKRVWSKEEKKNDEKEEKREPVDEESIDKKTPHGRLLSYVNVLSKLDVKRNSKNDPELGLEKANIIKKYLIPNQKLSYYQLIRLLHNPNHVLESRSRFPFKGYKIRCFFLGKYNEVLGRIPESKTEELLVDYYNEIKPSYAK